MLNIHRLNKSFGAHHVLKDFELLIEANALTAIIGPNGCGKSTLFNVLTGELSADSGDIRFNDESLLGLRPRQIAQRGVLRKFQIPGIYANMTVAEHLQLPFIIQKKKTDKPLIAQTAERMNLSAQLHNKGGLLATGQKQWLELAMLVLLSPTLLLLDEPIAGMTETEVQTTLTILHGLNHDGLTIVTIEHNMDFVKALTDDIVVMMDGQVIKRSHYADIAADERIKADYLGSLYS